MVKVRRLAALTCLSLLGLVAAACGGSEPTGAGGEAPVIGVSMYTKVIPLYVDMRKGMESAASERGVTLDFSYADNNAQNQVNQIQNFINRDVDLILCSPFDAEALVPAYEAARSAGIPIISVANKVDDQYEDAFIGRDWAEFGHEMVKAVAKASGGEGKVGVIQGPPAIDVVRAVARGWEQGFAENPGLEPLEPLVDPDMSTAKAVDLANTLFASHPDVVAVVATIDLMGLGVAQAATEQGIDHDKLFIASMDADPTSVEQVRNGNGIDFTVSMRAETWGEQAVNVAADWLEGDKPAGHTVENQATIITAENVDELSPEDLR